MFDVDILVLLINNERIDEFPNLLVDAKYKMNFELF
jgi:hypothetical protein